VNYRWREGADIKKPARARSYAAGYISLKDCALVDAGWRRFWSKRGGVPSLDLMDFTPEHEIKELTAHQARLKKPLGARRK
jgi:hypothetical protein